MRLEYTQNLLVRRAAIAVAGRAPDGIFDEEMLIARPPMKVDSKLVGDFLGEC
jgi:hypothetical protein